MQGEEIQSIIESLTKSGNKHISLVETHISWVILTTRFAFKIKKPVSFSFLDFSSVEKRKFYCERELYLNSRLAKDVYLGVLPVKKQANKTTIGGSAGKIIDYAVRMKRLLPSREMDRMLAIGKVKASHAVAVAETLAPFHRQAEVIKQPFDIKKLRWLFNDVNSVQGYIETQFKNRGNIILSEAMRKSDAFISAHRQNFVQRVKDGFIRDCHGDLHSGNIFLYKKPVIFDCLEFNDAFRQIDILNELAFFCMDMEEYGRKDLSDKFLKHYNKLFPVISNVSDEALFRYYKLYRANVRTKVNALKAMQETNEQNLKKRVRMIASYLRLMARYTREL